MMQTTKVYNWLLAILVSLLLPLAAGAEGAHWNQNSTSAPSTSPYLTVGNPTELDQNRPLQESTGDFLKFTDNGAKMPFTLEFDTAALPITRGGTGGLTQQTAIDSLLGLPSIASGDIIVFDGANWSLKHKGANGTFWGVSGGVADYYTPAGSGTVTSVGLSVPSWLSVGGTPVTGSGTLAVSNGTGLTADRVVGTNGAGALDLMALTAAQVPNLDAAKITSGALAKAQQHASTVYNDAGNAYSGTATQDMSASGQTLLIPIKASGGTTGEINLNSTDLEFRSAGVTHKAAKQATTITAGTGLSGGGDLSTGRTLNISTVPLANGGSNADLSGATTGAVIYKGASALTSLTPVASKLIGFNSGATAITTYDQPTGGLYGDGADGAKTISSNTTETVPKIFRCTTLTIQTGCTWTVKSGTLILCSGAVDIQGTGQLVVAADIPGATGETAAYYPSNLGLGPSPGLREAASYQNSISGAGCGGNGGNGGYTAGFNAAKGGQARLPCVGLTGSGGAGGTTGGQSGVCGDGGGGGGSVGLYSGSTITIGASAKITANGGAGTAQTGSYGAGGSGGSGGVIDMGALTSITNSGTIEAKGGAGGNGVNNGFAAAGGGGGVVVMTSASITAGTITLTGGAAGTGGTAYTTAPTAGSTGTSYSTTAVPVKYRCF